MTSAHGSGSVDSAIEELLRNCDPDVRALATTARRLIRELIPDATEEVDTTARLIGYSYIPNTYKGLVMAIQLHGTYVNLMFKGVELLELDPDALLEGTGKLARHIKVRSAARLDQPGVRGLIVAAATRASR